MQDTDKGWAIVGDDGPESVFIPAGTPIYPSSPAPASPPIVVIGSGFIFGIPGIFGNATIPAAPEDNAVADPDTSLVTEQSPDPTPRQAAKPKAAKHPQEH